MQKIIYCVCLAGLLSAAAGLARAEGCWLAPTNGWEHNYVAAESNGVPHQYSTLWINTDYQTIDPAGLRYAAIVPDPVEGDVLMLVHTNNASPYYSMQSAPGAGTTNDLITLDCRFRLADDTKSDEQPQLMLGVVRPRLDGIDAGGWNQWILLFRKQNLTVNGTPINVPLGTNWHNLRLVADVARNTAWFFLDNNPAPLYSGPSSFYTHTNQRNWIAFGDSGSTVDGQACVKYLRWTTTELANPWEAKLAQALNRPREVIYNNDGNEPFLWPTNETFSIAGFLDMRTTPVLGSRVDSVFYCPISSGFGFLSANIPSADLMLRKFEHLPDKKNVLQNFLDMGTDPVQEVVSWCRTNTLEVFVSLRVNDTHDSGTDQTKLGPPYTYPGNALFSPFKIQHPEYLMGSCTSRPPYCTWSAVDFTHGPVRERLFQMCRDLCTHYDVDGLDLDFFRHPQLFKSVAWGGVASDAERGMMTALMRRIRVAAEAEGKRRGRPILISIRVPDSVSYCRDTGIDLETWLREGLLDLLITSGYWRHNPWEYTVDLCRRYNVKGYASLDESRLGELVASALNRQTVATYRGRAMAARQAGMDGIMYFNLFSSTAIRNFMEGNPERMRLDDKSYFVSYRGHQYHAGRYVKGSEQHFVLPELSVSAPAQIAPGENRVFPLWIGDDVEALSQADIHPRCELLLDVVIPEGALLSVTVNGHTVAGEPVDGRLRRYPLRVEDLVCGENTLGFSVAEGSGLQAVTLKDAGVFLTELPKPTWPGVGSSGLYGYYEGVVPIEVMNHAQGWTASCKLRILQMSHDASGAIMRCFDQANTWSILIKPDGCYYRNAAGVLVRLGSNSRPAQYHMFQMYYDPTGDGGNGTVSYYRNGWLIQTLTRTDTFTNGSSENLFQWGFDSVPSATSTVRWNFVEFAQGNRVIAPIQHEGTLIWVR